MANLTPERIEEWREEAQFQHDRYQRDGTGIGTVLALTQARLLRALTELSAIRGRDGCTGARNEARVFTRWAGADSSTGRWENGTDACRRRLPSRRGGCPDHGRRS